MFRAFFNAASGSLVITVSAAAKGLFQIILASCIYTWADAETSARVFQYLFLQSAVISLLSASGYFRGYSASHCSIKLSSALLQHLALSLAFLTALVVSFICYPLTFQDWDYVLILSLGAVLVSLSAPLQGSLVQQHGFRTAFFPQAISSLIGITMLLLSPVQSVLAALLFSVVVQMIVLATYLVMLKNVSLSSLIKATQISFLPGFVNYLGIGLINFGGLFILFFVREYWVSGVSAEVVAAVFFVLRVADLVLGVGTQILVKFSGNFKIFHSFDVRIYLGSAFLFLSSASVVVTSFQFLEVMAAAVVAQIFVELWRYPVAVLFVERAKRFAFLPFAIFAIIPHAISIFVTFTLGWLQKDFGIQFYLSLVALTSCFIVATDRRIRPQKNSDD